MRKLCTKTHLFKNMVRKMNNFEQLLIEIGISYISTLKSPQHQSVDRNIGFTKGRIFFCYLIQLRVPANEVINREIQLRDINGFKQGKGNGFK